MLKRLMLAASMLVFAILPNPVAAEMKSWDGKYSVDKIEVSLVYFLPSDRTALPDWRERLDYFKRRLEQFHQREFQGQSVLAAKVKEVPFVSERTTAQLRAGDANFIFFRTLREVDERLAFGREKERQAFPILLVLSDINWLPLDDFYRVKPVGDRYEFEGQLINGRHHPGSAAGGARATYLSDRGVGWGLVSADGWRVPYSGSDCVAYHEGVGHTIGMPHNEPGDGAVMSMGQYRGWLSQSWVDDGQKKRLGFKAPEAKPDLAKDLFSHFQAWPQPLIPKPNEDVQLKVSVPKELTLKSCRVRIQTELRGAWLEVPGSKAALSSGVVDLGRFGRATPVSYRADVETTDGQTAELWGYFQVRSEADKPPFPHQFDGLSLASTAVAEAEIKPEIDVLKLIDLKRDRVAGDWMLEDGRLDSPKQYGARIELPTDAPAEYRLVVIAEPLDQPNGLILGQQVDGHHCLVLLNHVSGEKAFGAIENVDGKNVGRNSTTFERAVFQQGVPSEVICTVRKNSIRVTVDGREVIDWKGDASRLSLGDYWKTPNEKRLFLGAYDCRYRFHRVSVSPL